MLSRASRQFLVCFLVMFLLTVLSACNKIERCQEDFEADPPRLIETNQLCGCVSAPVTCSSGQTCFQGNCCSLDVDGLNNASCGCSTTCGDDLSCKVDELGAYYCCDPTAPPGSDPADPDACGCGPACEERYEDCAQQDDGSYQCECVPEKNLYNTNNCGCEGACAGGELCVEGECICDPNNLENETNDDDCGCTGEICQDDSHCRDGRCLCPEPGEEYCDHTCQAVAICECTPELHLSDASNCGCAGPCGNDETCESGVCVDACDPTEHASDITDCGCDGPCNPDETCESGVCAAECVPEEHDADPTDCGCKGECSAGELCEPCDGSEGCVAKCSCDPAYHESDSSDCGCEGPCGAGEACEDGECVCNPLAHLSDSSDCGCDGACKTWDSSTGFGVDEICSAGTCQCPSGYYPLNVYTCFADDMTVVSSRDGMCVASDTSISGQMCIDGYTFCTAPYHCEYEMSGTCSDGINKVTDVDCEE